MIGQRALTWAAALALMATFSMASQPVRFWGPVASALAQGDAATDAGEPAELAILALHCAEAPATEALTSFFATGAAPSDCSPAVGVTISVSERGAPVPGSPFTTDVAGTVVLPVTPGSALEVTEDPLSLPSGYEPITEEANGVPYANPVQIDSAVAGAAVLFVNVPRAAAEVAQDAPAAAAGEPVDLPVVALQCAGPPQAETLTSFFRDGTPPSGCAPAVGVSVAVMENETPLSGSPFTTDADGALTVPVRVGSAVEVRADPRSLPPGYEPLTRQANGVPYANPVQIESATADAAVLFVNVPASVAANLAEDPLAVGAGGATNLAHAATRDRTGCDPAYPDERTCIAPGRPLAAPCAITEQRNFTVLAPDPRGLDADRDGIGCEPIAPRGSTITRVAGVNLYRGGAIRRVAPAGAAVPVAAVRAPSNSGRWISPPENRPAGALVVYRARGSAGLWYVSPARSRAGSVAIVSNPVFIANGLWGWPNRINRNDWIWRSGAHNGGGVWFQPNAINVGNVVVAGSGSGSVAIASNTIVIRSGVWAWPDRGHADDWLWRNRFGHGAWSWPSRLGNGAWGWANRTMHDDWRWGAPAGNHDWNRLSRFGARIWGWPSAISAGNLTFASSGSGHGNGSVAIVSNPVFISSGVWRWSGHGQNDGWFWKHGINNGQWRGLNLFGKSVWGWPRAISVGNLAIARSGDNIAIVSNPIVVITSGLWFVPPDRNHDRDWLGRGDGGHGGRNYADSQLIQSGDAQTDPSAAEAQAIDGSGASDSPTGKIEPLATSEEPTLTVNGELAVESAPADAMQPPSDSAAEPPAELVQPASEGAIESPGDDAVAAPLDTTAQPLADASATEPSYVAPDPGLVDAGAVAAGDVDAGYVASEAGVDPGYVVSEPIVDPGYVDPGYVETGYVEPVYVEQEPAYVDPGVDPGYVAPEPIYVEPSYVEPTYIEPTYVEPTYVEPSYVEPSYVEPSYVDAGNVDAGYMAPDPVIEPSYSAPQPSYVDPGADANYLAPEPIYVAPEASYGDAGNGAANSGMDAGFGGQNAGAIAPQPDFADSGMDAGNAGAGAMAPDAGMDGAGNGDAGSIAPDSGGGGGGNDQGGESHD